MSRAFVNEDAGADRPDLPELPLSSEPNYVTPRGLRTLQSRLARRLTELAALKARVERLDKLPEAAAERDIRWLEARLKSAILIDPASQGLGVVAFGLVVAVVDPEGREARYEIVGTDEADPARGWIAPHSPLARALLGAEVGDEVIWRRPTGNLALEITGIFHADDDPPA